MSDFVTREEYNDLLTKGAALEEALLQLMGNRMAIVVALRAVIRTHPQPEHLMDTLRAALDPSTMPSTWHGPFLAGVQGTALDILREAVETGVQAQARDQTKN